MVEESIQKGEGGGGGRERCLEVFIKVKVVFLHAACKQICLSLLIGTLSLRRDADCK